MSESLSRSLLELVQALMRYTAARRKELDNPKWKDSKSIRTILGTGFWIEAPERVKSDLIPMSASAWSAWEEMYDTQRGSWGQHQKAGLAYEHAVPLGVLYELLLEAREDIHALDQTLRSLFHIVWVTKQEDRLLNKSGLRSKMPAGWDRQDPFARYAAMGMDIHQAG